MGVIRIMGRGFDSHSITANSIVHSKKNHGEGGSKITDINDKALMHRFYGAVVVDGVPYRVLTLMREEQNPTVGDGIHSYEVQKIEVLDEETPNTPNGRSNVSDVFVSGANLLNNLEKSYDTGKNCLMRAELPMRVVICTVTRTGRRIYGPMGAWGLTSR